MSACQLRIAVSIESVLDAIQEQPCLEEANHILSGYSGRLFWKPETFKRYEHKLGQIIRLKYAILRKTDDIDADLLGLERDMTTRPLVSDRW
jgi:hypothetical protein